ncbi:MAG: hypothetical protein E7658_09875 [Ruminococcaceae bacterium]|nr:hypothetical protein [Oscillospiraceae bacterium]
MKKHLKQEMDKLAGEFTHSAAQAAMAEASAELEAEYDTMVESGKSELEAYRAVLKDVEKMREILAALPKTEEEREAEAEKAKSRAWRKKVNGIHGHLEGLMWVATVILYFLVSFTTGWWHLTWLMFLGGAMGSILLSIVSAWLKGKPLSKQGGKWRGLMWLGITELYFLISFLLGGWHLTWLIFVLGAMIEILLGLASKWKE